MPKPRTPLLLRRAAAETALLLAMGLFLGLLGPFGTIERGPLIRMTYWPIVIVGGGVIGIAIDLLVTRRTTGFWLRLAADSLLMTLPVTALVWEVSGLMLGPPADQPHLAGLVFQVFVISFGVMLLRQLAWRGVWTQRSAPEAEIQAEAADAFRRRLSAKRRAARLLAVEAEDHYLRVHTDAGDELITARFSDALLELGGLAGYQTHRSWWVAAGAIEAVRWRRGRGELRLATGLTAPVSRTHTAVLKREGWF
jgi:DNA-binding LytR/AlgR family response regulator